MNCCTKTFFLAASFLAMSSCAKVHSTVTQGTPVTNNTPGGGLPSNVVSQSSIQGSWASACTTGSDAKGGPTYTTSTLVISSDSITTDTIFYDEATCAAPVSEELRVSSYTVLVADTTSLVETLVSTQLRALNTFLANLQNQDKYCGLTNWVANTYQTFLPNDTTSCSGLEGNAQNINSRLFGAKELYLDDCLSSADTKCTTLRYTRTAD